MIEGQQQVKKISWRQSINSHHNGASYFLNLDDIFAANPTDYYHHRSMQSKHESRLSKNSNHGWLASETETLADPPSLRIKMQLDF